MVLNKLMIESILCIVAVTLLIVRVKLQEAEG